MIFNPAARGTKAERLKKFVQSMDPGVVLRSTSGPNAAVALAAAAVREGFDTVVAAGGDGTLNEVLNGLGSVPGGLAQTRLGVLPLGTMNVFARDIGLPLALEPAWHVIRAGKEKRIDIGSVEFGADEVRAKRYFIQMAGAGLDARAIELVDFAAKKAVGPVAYVLAGLKALRHRQPKIGVNIDGTEQVEGEFILFGNGRLYGGPFRVFPGAIHTDGLLDVCVFPKMNYAVLTSRGLRMLLTKELSSNKLLRFKARRVVLEAGTHVPVEVDGEFAGQLPATVRVEPQALRVIVP
ncbi:MAG: diacylglycerol kinase family lipid kinase [Verrucomicrobiae bacterium]|nr:diacylglycerol kinase family lipid kinase [Verrucomicrobiae bacterium]MDW7979694.1 diacylglycerol kinase family lipid kinase [Verrucomicrobiales bacterium]